MAAILLLCCCCMSSSASGAFATGVIPGTSPHLEKVIDLKNARKYLDLSNEMRLLGMELPAESEITSDDLVVRNKMIDIFGKLQEKAPSVCALHTKFASEEYKTSVKEKLKYYNREGNESILTFKGMKDWKDYIEEYLEPTDDMKALYRNMDKSKSNSCSMRSLDDDGKCIPFRRVEVAVEENKDPCTDLKEMLELGPTELTDLIMKEK